MSHSIKEWMGLHLIETNESLSLKKLEQKHGIK